MSAGSNYEMKCIFVFYSGNCRLIRLSFYTCLLVYWQHKLNKFFHNFILGLSQTQKIDSSFLHNSLLIHYVGDPCFRSSRTTRDTNCSGCQEFIFISSRCTLSPFVTFVSGSPFKFFTSSTVNCRKR